jgi:hypothetical protein
LDLAQPMKEGVPKKIYRRKTETNFASKQKLKRFEENLVKSWSAKNSIILKHGLDPNQVFKSKRNVLK